MSPVVLKAMKKGNLKSFVSGERSRALWALLFSKAMIVSETSYKLCFIFAGYIQAVSGEVCNMSREEPQYSDQPM